MKDNVPPKMTTAPQFSDEESHETFTGAQEEKPP